MTEREYTEPDNKQLANFLAIYARRIPGMENLSFNPVILETMLVKPEFRQAALRHHRAFQDEIHDLHEKVMAGELPCSYIRPNGKHCPNYNEPGSFYCGLHKESDEDDGGSAVTP